MISSTFKTPATKKINTSHVWVKLLHSRFSGEQVIRCTLRTTAWDQATFGLHCFQTILTHCSQISYRGGQRLTKLRCTYQFKSPIKPKDSTPVFRNKATCTPTLPSHDLLFSPSQYCSMFREPWWISSLLSTSALANFPLRWDRQEKWPTLDFLKVRFRESPVRRLPRDSVALLVTLLVHKTDDLSQVLNGVRRNVAEERITRALK